MLLGISAVATLKTVGRGKTSSRRFVSGRVMVSVVESVAAPDVVQNVAAPTVWRGAALPDGSSMGWLQAAPGSYPACAIRP